MKNNRFKLLIGIVGFFSLSIVTAQQEPTHSLFTFDKNIYNPGFTGSSDWAVFSLKNRNQFIAMDGNPTTQTFNFHMPIQRRTMGIGFKVINDNIALMHNLNVSATYSYHLNFGSGKLSFGLEAGIYNRMIKYQDVVLTNPNDIAMPLQAQSSLVPDASWGLYYGKDEFYFGISQNHILGIAFNDDQQNSKQSKLKPHTSIILGHNFQLKKSKISISPNLLLRTVTGAPVQASINTIALYDNSYGLGVQYRSGDAFSIIARLVFMDSFKISYAYDVTTSKMSTYGKGSHEILLSYGIKLPPPPSVKEINPRYYF